MFAGQADSDTVLFPSSMDLPLGLNGYEVHVETLKLPESSTSPKIGFPTTSCTNTAPHLHIVVIVQIYILEAYPVSAELNLH